jgi:hypothetical protein
MAKHKTRNATQRRNKKHNKTRKFKKLNCAPDPSRKHEFTCFNTEKLILIRNAWNSRHPDVKITSSDPKEIWYRLKTYMSATCQNEMCWLKQQFIKNSLNSDLLHHTFAPKSPDSWKQKPDEWLDSLNIMSVMSQYEDKYKCFDFMGPSPINYDTHFENGECVWEELCELKITDLLKKNKNKLGIIFNLDPHYKSGSHWVALFVNLKKGTIYYFDSNGIAPPRQIRKLMNNIIDQCATIGMNMVKSHNTLRHQYSDSECGMYSLYFIIEMLKDRSFEYFLENRVPDKHMREFRKVYFN